MADIISVLSSSYASAPLASKPVKYVPVDPKAYTGTWNGTYANGQKFSFFISEVEGFRAKVKYQVDNRPPSLHEVLISNNSFRVGNTKFALGPKRGQAEVGTVVQNKTTGADVLLKGTAALQ